jgi:hypothetical protein
LSLLNEIHITTNSRCWSEFTTSAYEQETGLAGTIEGENTEAFNNWHNEKIEKIIESSETITNIKDVPCFFGSEARTTEEDELVMNIKNEIDAYTILELIDLTIKTKKKYYIGLIIYKMYKGNYRLNCFKEPISNIRNNRSKNFIKSVDLLKNENNKWVKTSVELLLNNAFKQIIKFFENEQIRIETTSAICPNDESSKVITYIKRIICSLKINKNLRLSILNDSLKSFFIDNTPKLSHIKTFFRDELSNIKEELFSIQNVVSSLDKYDEMYENNMEAINFVIHESLKSLNNSKRKSSILIDLSKIL